MGDTTRVSVKLTEDELVEIVKALDYDPENARGTLGARQFGKLINRLLDAQREAQGYS